jgi:hypothetical protein
MGEKKRRWKAMGITNANASWMLKPIYTFVAKDGENIHIDVEALRRWTIKTLPEIFFLPIDMQLAVSFVEKNTISLARVQYMMNHRDLLDAPVIFCKDGTYGPDGAPNVMLADGHHRFFIKGIILHEPFIEGHMLEPEQWRPFQMHGLPSLTEQHLRNIPPTRRNY